MAQNAIPTFQCLLIGKEQEEKDTKTLAFNTNRGIIEFALWYTNDPNKFAESFFQDCSLIMLDEPSYNTFWENFCFCKNELPVHIVLGGLKGVSQDWDAEETALTFLPKKCMKDDVSLSKFVWKKRNPFLVAARKLIHDKNLQFVPMTAPMPPDVSMDAVNWQLVQQRLKEAHEAPLPPPDDDF